MNEIASMSGKRKFHEITDLTGTDNVVLSSSVCKVTSLRRRSNAMQERKAVINIGLLKRIPNEILQYIFNELLQIDAIISVLNTSKDILHNAIHIKCTALNQMIPRNLLFSRNKMMSYVLNDSMMRPFVSAANRNFQIIQTLRQNEIFQYYHNGKTSTFVVIKCFTMSALVQKIHVVENRTINVRGRTMLIVRKLSSKKNMTVKTMSEKCIFSIMRHRDICYIDKIGALKECVYYSDEEDTFINERDINSFEII